jgi:pimeloyl-ACP methyl ester carboxylesterase
MPAPMNDLVVLVPGILGSELWKNGRMIWGFKDGLRELFALRGNLRRAIDDLKLHGDDPALLELGDGVEATRLLSVPQVIVGFYKSDGYDLLRERLLKSFQLRDGPPGARHVNYVEFPYDWRRGNQAAAQRLKMIVDERLERWQKDTGNKKARAIFICHSMGGLVARYYLEVLGGWEKSCRALITLGTPFRGAVDALNSLANGFSIAGVELTEVLRTCTSAYQLLPIYKMIDVGMDEDRRVDDVDIAGVDRQRARAAREQFHDAIKNAVAARSDRGYLTFTFSGLDQPTLQSASLEGNTITAHEEVPAEWASYRQNGDGTVPYGSSIPLELSNDPRGAHAVSGRHAMLQSNDEIWRQMRLLLHRLQDQSLRDIEAVDTEPSAEEPPALQLRLDSLFTGDAPVVVRARVLRPVKPVGELKVQCQAVGSGMVVEVPMKQQGDEWGAEVPNLPDGFYRVKVSSAFGGPFDPLPVEDIVEVDRTTPIK